MRTFLRVLAGFLILFGLIWFAFSVDMATSDKPDERESAAALFIILAVIWAPGFGIVARDLARTRRERTEALLVAFVKARDAFTVAEMASKIHRPEAETEALLVELAAKHKLDIVLHKASGQYCQRSRLAEQDDLAERCPGCNAVVGPQLVLAGQRPTCPYCGQLLGK